MIKHYDTVIFDLDGTLLNSLEDLMDSTNAALSANGYPIRSLEEIRRFVGNGVARLIHLSVPKNTSADAEAKCLSDFKAYYGNNMTNKTAPYPGILDMLMDLKENGYHLAVVSNKIDTAVNHLNSVYFADIFKIALGETQGLRKKPAPDLVERCFSQLGVSPSRAVYVGDSEVDIETAHNADLPCISVSWGFRPREFLQEHGASVIADTTEELLNLL